MEFRSLYPEELEAWLDHVTHVFSASRQYFSNHWHNDPWKDVEGIRVAVDDGKIVSTVRVFIRKMYFHGEPISVGGIGEVSTRPEYRTRGLATQLLKDSIQFMEDRQIAISMLHGSQRIYSVEGWQSVPRYYAKKTFIGRKQREWNIRQTNFQDSNEIAQLASLYDSYSRKFNGTFARDDMAYWTDWVKTESPQAWVAERDGVIDGYVSVRERNGQLGVKEFAASKELFAENRATDFFDVLLSDIIVQMDAEKLEVEYPAPIADGFNAPKVEAYGSTMYRIIQPDAFPLKMRQEISDVLPDLLHSQSETLRQDIRSHHIFWSTDGF
ncbi:MAG: GNAT family N-acetyltransferase [Candidatus Poribacteria bacterium]|nr:GNAT family N-acetyltransferase [Candidatus Poribacteria bacterium]